MALAYFLSKPYIKNKVKYLENKKDDIYKLFHLPLLFGVALLCFAHGANDVANAVKLLMEPEADFINCSIIYCDGGEHRSGSF